MRSNTIIINFFRFTIHYPLFLIDILVKNVYNYIIIGAEYFCAMSRLLYIFVRDIYYE